MCTIRGCYEVEKTDIYHRRRRTRCCVRVRHASSLNLSLLLFITSIPIRVTYYDDINNNIITVIDHYYYFCCCRFLRLTVAVFVWSAIFDVVGRPRDHCNPADGRCVRVDSKVYSRPEPHGGFQSSTV